MKNRPERLAETLMRLEAVLLSWADNWLRFAGHVTGAVGVEVYLHPDGVAGCDDTEDTGCQDDECQDGVNDGEADGLTDSVHATAAHDVDGIDDARCDIEPQLEASEEHHDGEGEQHEAYDLLCQILHFFHPLPLEESSLLDRD